MLLPHNEYLQNRRLYMLRITMALCAECKIIVQYNWNTHN
jgi:hypothetical protein